MKITKYIAIIFVIMAINSYGQRFDWKITLRVVDDAGKPVPGAKASVGYMRTNEFVGITDTNGLFIASHRDGSENMVFQAKKVGYYPFFLRYEAGARHTPGKWSYVQTLVLNRIVSPTAMYAKRINMEPPVDDKAVGYDLVRGDWVAPYGGGVNRDIIFYRKYQGKSLQDYDYKLTVSFPKIGDGIQEVPYSYKMMEGSELRSPYLAPTNGYQPQIMRLNISHPGQKLVYDFDENRVYLFRVRTSLDGSSNVLSACYGKIYGDFMEFDYYLNPTPKDRNVEFDPKRNLFRNPPDLESVSAP